MTMIKTVARAIERHTGNQAVDWTGAARAAIEAMRDVGDDVVVSAFEAELKDPNGFVATMTDSEDFKRWFVRVLDAALSEGTPP